MSYLPITSYQRQWQLSQFGYVANDLIVPDRALPNNFWIANVAGIYSMFVKINRYNWDPVNGFNSSVPHPAFQVNSVKPLATPVGTPSTLGGSMGAGTYYYVVTGLNASGESLPSNQTLAIVTTGTTSSVALSWNAVTGATSYKVYRTTISGTYGATSYIANPSVNSYTDIALAASAGSPPTSDAMERDIYFGKYTGCGFDANGNVVTSGAIYAGSRPFVQQYSYITFDQALALCAANNGNGITGYHMGTNAEWAALQILSINGNTQPYGNTNFGRDDRDPSIVGRCYTLSQFGVSSDQARWLTGSGGVKTSHNFDPSGVFDLNGNVWKWVGGMRVNNGEINILAQNNAADSTKDQTASSTQWMAILDDGSLVAPGTAGTLRISTAGNITKAVQAGSGYKTFETITCEADVSTSSAGIALLKQLGLYPYTTGLNGDGFWWNLTGEFLLIRGGGCGNGSGTGVSAADLSDGRGGSFWSFGFPLAFVL